MFISRVELPWDAARNPYDLHKNLWRMFPGEAREVRATGDEARQGFLFRIEHNPIGRAARLLVQSRRAPVQANGVQLMGSREIHPQPSPGQRLSFLLTANPTKTITDTQRDAKPGKRSDKCRVPLIREDDQCQWLSRKLGKGGNIEAVNIQPHPPLLFRKGRYAGKLVTATFEGILCVSDPERLITLLENGIGPAKAFGCGLLLLRRI